MLNGATIALSASHQALFFNVDRTLFSKRHSRMRA